MNITTALVWPNGKAYFFACGNQYIRYDIAADIADQLPRPVAPNWPGLATAFPNGIDAAVAWPNGRSYFFKGKQYVAYNMDPNHEGVVTGYPAAIGGVDSKGKELWPGLKAAGFDSNLDAVVVWPNDRAYFFKGNQYLAYNMDPAHEGVLPGYPTSIDGVSVDGKQFWPGIACTVPDSPLWMQLTHIRCLGETNDGSASDEIYVVMYSADIRGFVPAGIATMTPLFEDFDSGEVRLVGTTNWGLNGSPTGITDPSKIILLAGMMENDQSEPDAVKAAVNSSMIGNLVSYKQANLPRTEMVANLSNDMFAFEGLGALSGKLDTDERIGSCLEIPLSEANIIAARLGRIVRKELTFVGDGGVYQVRWQMGMVGTKPDLSPLW